MTLIMIPICLVIAVIAKFLVPRLKAFKECTNGFPSRLTEKKWNKILDEMIEGFELHCTKDEWEFEQDLNARNEKLAKVNKALKHFSKLLSRFMVVIKLIRR